MNIKTHILKEIMKKIITFEQLDKIFYNHFPKDLNLYIFQFIDPVCKDCRECCEICYCYCYLNCLRYNKRNICCKSELSNLLEKYELVDDNETENENQNDRENQTNPINSIQSIIINIETDEYQSA